MAYNKSKLMDNFTLLFIITAAGGIFLFWKTVKFFYKKLVGILPKADEGKKYVEGELLDDITNKLADTIKNLEAERVIYYNKSRGLYKRAFLKTWFLIWIFFVGLALFLGDSNEVDIIMFIGPTIGAAFLALIGSGIYTLVKKGTYLNNFTRKLKQELVGEIVKIVNPNLTFYDEGIDEEEFNQADIFPDGKNTSLRSEDTIKGTIEGTNVVISECVKSGRVSSSQRTTVKVKGVTISQGNREFGQAADSIEYFRGLFIQMELKNMHIPSPLKVIPQNRIRKELKTGFVVKGYPHYIKSLNPEDRLDNNPKIDNKPYNIYCSAKDEGERLLTANFIKIIDFIYNKYYEKRESNDSNSLIGQRLFKERGVYITIRNNRLYMALEWNRDMFEPDVFLKNNLIESGLAQEIYEDLKFIDQVIKEINLFNKVAV